MDRLLLLEVRGLLAASRTEINRERRRLASTLSCAVTILGQVLKAVPLTSCVYFPFFTWEFVGVWLGALLLNVRLLCAPSRAALVTHPWWGVGVGVMLCRHDISGALKKKNLYPLNHTVANMFHSDCWGKQVSHWPRSAAYSPPLSDDALCLRGNMKLQRGQFLYRKIKHGVLCWPLYSSTVSGLCIQRRPTSQVLEHSSSEPKQWQS